MMKPVDAGESAPIRDLSTPRRTAKIRQTLLVVLLLNLLVAIAKLAYGLISGSLSMTADGINSLMDGAANVVGLIGLAIAARPPDPNHPYGHRRFETITALAIAMAMVLAVIQIVQEAWHRWQAGTIPEVTPFSFAIMGGTLLVNVGVTLWERRRGRELRSSILVADAKHTAADALVSISVIAGLAAVRFGFPTADLVLAIAVAGVITWGAWTIMRDAALTLSDTAAAPVEVIERAARTVPGVRGIHNIRTRSGEGLVWVDLHIQVDPHLRVEQAHEIASAVAARVEEELGQPADVTVHIEPATSRHLRPTRGYRPWHEER
ncbi:cation diffusion facilitator family transporter [Thermomicrobiaceae bacterium CFH 74404]|uniref:Cation diffusion facilitator family transporter n=1 Tax=Thermalbibacter longus TaxID=2951981 RepID=A0AA41WFY5_9BACT|nr:cation diffusion facilitator family transporter [Thermalbibacter longus]MCM8749345.1 cation diffusion facilitator family transporter [Thermalbibacter longus]